MFLTYNKFLQINKKKMNALKEKWAKKNFKADF